MNSTELNTDGKRSSISPSDSPGLQLRVIKELIELTRKSHE